MRAGLSARLAAVVLTTVAVVAGCTSSPTTPLLDRPSRTVEPPFGGAATLPPPDMTDAGPGSLLDVSPLAGIESLDDANATAVRVEYRSTGGDGEPTRVSGVVVVPPGQPPRGGWPVISFGHMVTGVLTRCAPSDAEELGGYASIIGPLVTRGYLVTMTDYQGLGVSGFHHPVLDGTTLANNMIDAVRAARHVAPSASTRWAAYGVGQGGLAAWAADERAPSYGQGLELVGAASLSPYANMTPMLDAVQDRTLDPQQYRLQALILDSLTNPPDNLNLDDYRSQSAKDDWDALTNCALKDPAEGDRALARLTPDDLRPRDQAAADDLRAALTRYALPGQSATLAAPLLVVYATDDRNFPAVWVEPSVQNACIKGQPVQVFKRVGELDSTSPWILDDVVAWLHARFDGQNITDVCVGAW